MERILNDCHIDINNIITPLDVYDYNELIEEDQKRENIICIICTNIVEQPLFCSKENNHVFCKECITQYLVEYKFCPLCKTLKKTVDDFYEKKEYNEKLKELRFKCKGCNQIIKYQDYLCHKNNCIKDYECQVPIFEISSRGNIYRKNLNIFHLCKKIFNSNDIIEHINNCALKRKFYEYEKNHEEYIYSLNRSQNENKIKIIYYPNGNR